MSTTPTQTVEVPVKDVPLTGEARLAQMARAKLQRKRKEAAIEFVLLLAACVSVFTTAGIVYILVKESIVFFGDVPVWDFLTDTQWHEGGGGVRKLAQARHRADEPPQHPLVLAHDRTVVRLDGVLHPELRRREEPGVIDQSGHQDA